MFLHYPIKMYCPTCIKKYLALDENIDAVRTIGVGKYTCIWCENYIVDFGYKIIRTSVSWTYKEK